ncbi:MAG: hypothetical protein Q8P50_11865 [Bacillota bacterium]|nr:hypothetical protein [Bacillota bacterium]
MRTGLALAIAVVVGIGMTLDYFVKLPALNNSMADVRNWMPIVTSFAVMVGAAGLLNVHYRNIQRKRGVWYNSVVLWVVMMWTIVWGISFGTADKTYIFVFDNVLTSSSTTLSAVGALYLGSSAFRAFRATNVNAAVLLLSGSIVMLAQVPIGEAISGWIPAMGDWIMNILNTAGQRGIMIASGIGFMTVCVRIMLGYNRSYLGSGQ